MAQPIQLNGVNVMTGEYLMPPLGVEDVSQVAQGRPLEAEQLDRLKAKEQLAAGTYGVPFGVDPEDLAQAGWGVVFAHDADPAVRAALAPLLALRKAQAGERYFEATGYTGHRPGESCLDFLTRFHVGPYEPPDPKKVPYYLLVVGDPERIPYRFQFELDVNYAVGRLDLDGPEQYAAYARSVVEAEKAASPATRRAVLFGTSNANDPATAMSAAHLVAPLAQELPGVAPAGWSFEKIEPAQATKKKLRDDVLRGADRPSLLFTASHGVGGFPIDDPRLFSDTGALLCQEWPGRFYRGPISSDWYLSATDLDPTTDSLAGTIAFFFACYGAGTPRLDDFVKKGETPSEIAPRAFVAGLPRRMLSLPKGGALAVIGHVERAWTFSFDWPGAGEQVGTFKSALSAILNGGRVGAAMEAFAMKHAAAAVGLNGELQNVSLGKTPNDLLLATLWTANNDARNYVVVGDPAVRLVV